MGLFKTKSLRLGCCQDVVDVCDSGVEDVFSANRSPRCCSPLHPRSKKPTSSFEAVTTSASELISLATVIIHKFKVPFVVFKGGLLQPPLSRLELYRRVRLFLPRMCTSCRWNVIHRGP